MIKIIGVRFREAGKIYYFSPGKRKISRGDQVIVETARGVEMGRVVLGEKEVPEEEIVPPLKEVTRIATEEDLKRMLGVYFEQNVTTERYEDHDGERWVLFGE